MEKDFVKLILAILSVASIQSLFADDLVPPPEYSVYDENQVNLVTGYRTINKVDLLIGSGDLALEHSMKSYENGFRTYTDNFFGSLDGYVTNDGIGRYTVAFGGSSHTFEVQNGLYVDRQKSGAILEKLSDTKWRYTMSDGIEVYFSTDINLYDDKSSGNFTVTVSGGETHYRSMASPTKIDYPNGFEVVLHFISRQDNSGSTVHRIQSVTTNNGLQLKYRYQSNLSTSDMELWAKPKDIIAVNNAIDYCDPVANECSFSKDWPSVQYSWPNDIYVDGAILTITESNGQRTKYKHGLFCTSGSGTGPCENGNVNVPRVTEITESSSVGTVTSQYEYGNTYVCTNDWMAWDCSTVRPAVVIRSLKGYAEWTYNYSIPEYSYVPYNNTSTGPQGIFSVLVNSFSSAPFRVTDTVKGVQYDLGEGYENYIETVTYDYGNGVGLSYDSIGNVTEKRLIAKSGPGLSDIVLTADYGNNCADNAKTQKKPSWVRDAKSKQIDYIYHCASGNVATITKPASNNGFRPQTRYTYVQKYARYKTNSGQIVQASSPIWVLNSESYCQKSIASGAGCTQVDDEVVTSYEYGSDAGANNLFLKGVVVTVGGEIHRTCYAYDDYGNRISETLPKAELSSCP